MLAFQKKNTTVLKNRFQVIMPKHILAYLEIHNIVISDVYMDDRADMKCQLCHIHLEQYLIQQKT